LCHIVRLNVMLWLNFGSLESFEVTHICKLRVDSCRQCLYCLEDVSVINTLVKDVLVSASIFILCIYAGSLSVLWSPLP